MAVLSRDEYFDRVYACWQGKNCGGTLGAPLEEPFGRAEPFAVDWYTELREGGIPNDDLELQLIWLKAVEERGFNLTAQDLAQYWLDHVGYNFDEYGLAKTNLRLGIPPPLSGSFNNWFRDCMGSPIRSEIWACLAPGVPELAVAYAREDARVDHAGGEGVWGEIFNAALQSAAFVCADRDELLAIALSYIPATSAVAIAVRTAMAAYQANQTWQEAREAVLLATPHTNAQYAPINLGFQTIGWLYGRDFGDALCTAVNCGYDTDCTGATLGALLGILGGRSGLPERWTNPLGTNIPTNESWGGVRHLSQGEHPVPTTLMALTERVCSLGERLLATRHAAVQIGAMTETADLCSERLYARSASLAQWYEDNATIPATVGEFTLQISHHDEPAIIPGQPHSLTVTLSHRQPDPITITISLMPPASWIVLEPLHQTMTLLPNVPVSLPYHVIASDAGQIANTNQLWLMVQPHERPTGGGLPIAVVGARQWQLWHPQVDDDLLPSRLLEHVFEAEIDMSPLSPDIAWQTAHATGNALPSELETGWDGVMYTRLYLWSANRRDVRLGYSATCPRKMWLNGQLAGTITASGPMRPSYAGLHDQSYADLTLQTGWNMVQIKYVRTAEMPPFGAHLTLAETEMPGLHAGIIDVLWTCFPWQQASRVDPTSSEQAG